MVKDRYEISVWEDYIVPKAGTIPEHFEERKVAIIGSNSMTAQCRAVEPRLVENINGTTTFTFKMYYVYTDIETGEKSQNPFLSLLVNERKIKVLWKDKWYDLVIKNIQEDSSGKSIIYTCKDLFITELSKTGFEITFDSELENDINSLEGFARETLKGSDWQLGEVDVIKQEKEEPVYEVTLNSSLACTNQTTGVVETLAAESNILVFYNQIQAIVNLTATSGSSKIQFAYAKEYERDTNSLLVNNSKCYQTTFSWKKSTSGTEKILTLTKESTNIVIHYEGNVSSSYRAKRLVEGYETVYDAKLDRYVDVYTYTQNGTTKTAHGYISSEFKSPAIVGNIITNGKDFKDTSGWIADNNGAVSFEVYSGSSSENTKVDDLVNARSCLVFKESGKYTVHYINTGLTDTLFLPNGLKKGQKFVYRYKARYKQNASAAVSKNYVTTKMPFTLQLSKYTLSNSGEIKLTYQDNGETKNFYNYITQNSVSKNGDWIEHIFTCNASLPKTKLLSDTYGLIFTAPRIEGGDFEAEYWIEEIQFFEEVKGEVYDEDGKNPQEVRINPEEYETLGKNITFYNYYDPKSSYTDEDDLEFLHSGPEDWNITGLAKKSVGFEKRRKIAIKNSNRFNILQSLAETFECWVRFEIEHDDSTGRVIYDKGLPQKRVVFKKEIGEEIGFGFIYGQDLKTISRTIVSDQVVTKTIVKANSNEFAPNGSCDIRMSSENYGKADFILDFGYFINQQLLDGGQVNKDLYLSTDSIGYFYHLEKEYTKYESLIKENSTIKSNLDELNALKETYNTIVTQCAEEITGLKTEYKTLTGSSYTESKIFDSNGEIKTTLKKNKEACAIIQKIVSLQSSYKSYKSELSNVNKSISTISKALDANAKNQKTSLEAVEAKNKEFYSKYSRFIQEGTWISEDYTDPNLYYLDAQSVAYTSSRPQISYNISVLRLSGLEEYQNKVFKLGDISFIQDTEFFGYVAEASIPTPYKEKVLISEVVSNFDSPDQDSFKIQNYKTQFEDLFQRITATTQNLQYAQAGYQKAASAFTETGTIKYETLQNSILTNQNLVFGAKNESVIQDNTGITVTDIKNPNKKTKVTSGGVFVSIDGGKTWKGAIRGEGLSTQYLTSGVINTSNIVITTGNYATFKWDNLGINAYDTMMTEGWLWDENEGTYKEAENAIIGINTSRFVRFDRFGLYGINGKEEFIPHTEDDVWENANYALTWKGFLLRNKTGNGSITISSEDDFLISDGSHDRIKIGRITTDNGLYYGIRFKNKAGAITMESDDGGNLWLRDKLSIGTLNNNKVSIGNLGQTDSDLNGHGGRVIDANNRFIVYEDGHINVESGSFKGHIEAESGSFKGHIEATSGKIGNMEIESLENLATAASNFSVAILSNSGTVFKGWGGEKVLTAVLYENNVETEPADITYQWSRDGQKIEGATKKTLTVKNTDGDELDVYTCEITITTKE